MNMMSDRRYGSFSIPHFWLKEEMNLVRQIMSTVIVLRAESKVINNYIEYDAYSLLFDPVEEGNLPPRYSAELENGNFVNWRKEE